MHICWKKSYIKIRLSVVIPPNPRWRPTAGGFATSRLTHYYFRLLLTLSSAFLTLNASNCYRRTKLTIVNVLLLLLPRFCVYFSRQQCSFCWWGLGTQYFLVLGTGYPSYATGAGKDLEKFGQVWIFWHSFWQFTANYQVKNFFIYSLFCLEILEFRQIWK